MAGPRKNPADVTGRQAEELARKHAEEQREAAERMSTISAAAEDRKDEVIDASSADVIVVEDPNRTIDVSETVEVESPTRTVRLNANLESLTVGAGNHWNDLKAGQKYRFPKNVADHLDEKGYVWH